MLCSDCMNTFAITYDRFEHVRHVFVRAVARANLWIEKVIGTCRSLCVHEGKSVPIARASGHQEDRFFVRGVGGTKDNDALCVMIDPQAVCVHGVHPGDMVDVDSQRVPEAGNLIVMEGSGTRELGRFVEHEGISYLCYYRDGHAHVVARDDMSPLRLVGVVTGLSRRTVS